MVSPAPTDPREAWYEDDGDPERRSEWHGRRARGRRQARGRGQPLLRRRSRGRSPGRLAARTAPQPTGVALIAGTVLASGVASYDASVVTVAVPAIGRRFDAPSRRSSGRSRAICWRW